MDADSHVLLPSRDVMKPTANDARRRDTRRKASAELAGLLGTPEGLRTARLLLSTGTVDSHAPSVPEPSAPSAEPRPISIWRPTNDGGELVFERPAPLPLGDHYAARRRLCAAKPAGTRRLAFFGESVAAGYLYAPGLTPARVLETQLGQLDGHWEVVDLARTNETLSGLAATVESSLQLDPDVLVIFAGNNWNLLETPQVSPWVPSVEARQRYAAALADGGPAGPARLALQELDRKASQTLDSIARVTSRAGVPIVLVVPEVNLADWESRQPAPWLPGGGTAQWYRYFADALKCLAAERWSAAIAFAHKMRELDGGHVGTTYRVLARAEIGRGRPADARWACQAEVDHTTYATLAFLDAPRATSQAQEILRRAVARHDWGLVDLPAVFGDTEPLPGRRLFLDYCHLTSEGMRIAMAAVASEVAGRLLGSVVERQKLERIDVEIPSSVEATACFGAAIHSAHRLLTLDGERPILEHWCRRALEASPEVAQTMTDFVEARCSPTPAVLTAAQQRNLPSPHRLLLQHGWRWDFLDAELVETICRVLEDAGRPVREDVTRLAVERLAAPDRPTDLSRPPWLWEPLERFYPEVMEAADVHEWGLLRALWPRSSFCLVHSVGEDLTLELTARRPSGKGTATILVNGRQVGRGELGETWGRHRFRVARDQLRAGFNRVTVEWPPLAPVGDEALRRARRSLELGREAAIHPVFGEVAALVSSTQT